MKFVNINDYQGGGFAIGRIWNGKKDLLEQILCWDYEFDEDEEGKEFFSKLSNWKVKEIVDWINDSWEIKIIPLRDISEQDKRELANDFHEFR